MTQQPTEAQPQQGVTFAATTTAPQQPQQAAQQPETGQQDDYKGAGSKEALKADLASERDKRQKLEAQVAELTKFREGLASLVGTDKGEKFDPEAAIAKLTETVQQTQQQLAESQRQNTLYAAMPKDVDPARILRNVDFLDSIKGLAPDDRDGIAKAITAFADANPWVKTTQQGSGGDLYAGGTSAKPAPPAGVPTLAAGLEQALKK